MWPQEHSLTGTGLWIPLRHSDKNRSEKSHSKSKSKSVRTEPNTACNYSGKPLNIGKHLKTCTDCLLCGWYDRFSGRSAWFTGETEKLTLKFIIPKPEFSKVISPFNAVVSKRRRLCVCCRNRIYDVLTVVGGTSTALLERTLETICRLEEGRPVKVFHSLTSPKFSVFCLRKS